MSTSHASDKARYGSDVTLSIDDFTRYADGRIAVRGCPTAATAGSKARTYDVVVSRAGVVWVRPRVWGVPDDDFEVGAPAVARHCADLGRWTGCARVAPGRRHDRR